MIIDSFDIENKLASTENNSKKEAPTTTTNNKQCNSKASSLNYKLEKINIQALKDHITCFLCKGIFRTPITINECMHTFCKACLFKHFYNQSTNNCPCCKVDLGGKPLDSVIFDNTIDSLIKILFPEFEAIDKENTEKMYEVFREKKTPLPGDPILDKKKKPSINISILPYKTDNSNEILPKLVSTKIQVAPNMDIQKFKKYLSFKLKNQDYEINEEELLVYYKNSVMRDDFSFANIEKQFGFPSDNKIVFSYARKIKS